MSSGIRLSCDEDKLVMTLPDKLSDLADFDVGRSDALILRVTGEVDLSSADYIRSQWTKMLSLRRPGQDVAIIDVTEVSFCGSVGLAALIQFQDDARNERLVLRLAVADDRVVRRPLRLTGLIERFEIYPNLGVALAGGSGR